MRIHHIDIRIAKIFNTLGPEMLLSQGKLISDLLVHSIYGEDLTVPGNGNQIISFYLIDALIL